ncbi:7088_t:CDS:1, partial [Racocetra persica]
PPTSRKPKSFQCEDHGIRKKPKSLNAQAIDYMNPECAKIIDCANQTASNITIMIKELKINEFYKKTC